MRYIMQKIFLDCYSLSKDRSKSHFWLQGPINGARRGVLEKFVLFRYSLALTSIFIIKVDFSANTDILTWVHDKDLDIWFSRYPKLKMVNFRPFGHFDTPTLRSNISGRFFCCSLKTINF